MNAIAVGIEDLVNKRIDHAILIADVRNHDRAVIEYEHLRVIKVVAGTTLGNFQEPVTGHLAVGDVDDVEIDIAAGSIAFPD
ncbi:hypothetical protein EG834_15455, partial [bacterium]|nr:hypothetical protein [bacterium]